jgi:hypothetical protein
MGEKRVRNGQPFADCPDQEAVTDDSNDENQ